MNTIKLFLKGWPLFYRKLQKIYYSFRRVIETHMPSIKIQEWIWKTQHIYEGSGWTNGYCESTSHPHCQFLLNLEKIYGLVWNYLEQ